MSRLFSATGTDVIYVNASAQVPASQGSFTVMALVKMTASLSSDQWIVQAYTAANVPIWGLLSAGGKFYNEGNFGGGNGAAVIDAWMTVGYSKAAGAVKSHWSIKNWTAGTAWQHFDDAANASDNAGTPAKISIGSRQQGNSSWRGNIAYVAAFNSVLTDTAFENAAVNAQALLAAGPKWGALLNQDSTATPVTDLSGNGSTQFSLTGTTVSADESPGWSYSLSPPGPTVKLWDGSAEVAVTVKLWDGSAEVPVSLSAIV